MGLDGTLLVVLKVAKKIRFFDRKLNSYFFSWSRDPVTESNPQTAVSFFKPHSFHVAN